MSADLNTVLERLDSLEARVNSRFDTQGDQIKELSSRFDTLEGRVDSGFVTQGEEFKKLVRLVSDRFDRLDRERV